MKGASSAPALSLDAAGRVHFHGPDFRVLGADGKELAAMPVPGGAGGFAAVNPVDGTIARRRRASLEHGPRTVALSHAEHSPGGWLVAIPPLRLGRAC